MLGLNPSQLGGPQSRARPNGDSSFVSSPKEWSGCLQETRDATVLPRIEGIRLIDGLGIDASLHVGVGGQYSPSIASLEGEEEWREVWGDLPLDSDLACSEHGSLKCLCYPLPIRLSRPHSSHLIFVS